LTYEKVNRQGGLSPLREGFVSRTIHRDRLFVCACLRKLWHLLKDERSRQAVEAAERYADGRCSRTQLYRACERATEAWQFLRQAFLYKRAEDYLEAIERYADFPRTPLEQEQTILAAQAALLAASRPLEWGWHDVIAELGRLTRNGRFARSRQT
jgi:hypothetical protein